MLTKLKAGALYYVVAVSIFVGLLLTAIIMLAYLKRYELDLVLLQKDLKNKALSGIEWSLLENADITEDSVLVLTDLFEDTDIEISVKNSYWGVLKCSFSKAEKGGYAYKSAAIIGSVAKYFPALMLVNSNRPVKLDGKLVVVGDAFVPAGTVEFSRSGLNMKDCFKGRVSSSASAAFPALDDRIWSVTDKLTEQAHINGGMVRSSTFISDSVYQSFWDNAMVYNSDQAITISSKAKLSGKVLVLSEVSISVERGAVLEDVILSAPTIVFEDGSRGVVQAVASDSIIVGRNVRLGHPSVLLLNIDRSLRQRAYVKQYDQSQVLGSIIVLGASSKLQTPSVIIHQGATMEGFVHTQQELLLNGLVNGTVLCKSITGLEQCKGGESLCMIDKAGLHDIWMYPAIFDHDIHKGNLKWLY